MTMVPPKVYVEAMHALYESVVRVAHEGGTRDNARRAGEQALWAYAHLPVLYDNRYREAQRAVETLGDVFNE